MPSQLIAEILKGLESLKADDIAELPPIERQRFAALLRHLAKLAEAGETPTGVLGDLANGDRDG